MKVLNKFIEGKNIEQSKCEDGFTITKDYVVVVDGASSKSNLSFSGKTSARYIMELILENINKLDKYLTADEFITSLNKLLRDIYERDGWLEKFSEHPKYRPTASMGVYSKYRNEVWLFSDCQVLLIDKDDKTVHIKNEKYIDEVTSAARKLFIESELLIGKSEEDIMDNDIGREFIFPLLERQQIFQNSNEDSIFSYGAVDGYGFNMKDLKIIELEDDIKEIVLATDGYRDLFSTLEKTELVLKEQLKNDPLSINELKGTKTFSSDNNSFDDRTYVKIRL